MKKIEVLNNSYEKLKSANIVGFEMDAQRLLAYALNISFNDLVKVKEIDEKSLKTFEKLVCDRCKHVPMDCLLGGTDFYNIHIPFNKSILTPRQETEFLVDRVVIDIKNMWKQTDLKHEPHPITVLDLCTGSGCVGIALANATGVNVTMSDISKSAIKIAKNNNTLNNKTRAEKLLPAINPNFVLSDMFENIKCKFDIIVCNPPYICSSELNKLEIEVRDFDPALALDGGKDGLDFYKIIASKASRYLENGGTLYLEIGINQSDKIVKLLDKHFDNIKVIKDLAGIDRFIIAKKRENNA